MMSFFVMALVATMGLSSFVCAQTPQQLEMLKERQGDKKVDEYPVTVDPETGKFIIPKNTNTQMIKMDNGTEQPLPMAKSDEEIRLTHRGPRYSYLARMSEEERMEYLNYLAEDRILAYTSDFKVTTSTTGLKYCQMQAHVVNNTPRQLHKIYLDFTWGETSTYGEFTDIAVKGEATLNIALAGSVCELVTKGPRYKVGECIMEGLTQDQCKMRFGSL